MRQYIIIITLCFNLFFYSVSAQKPKMSSLSKNAEIERVQSTLFADALREFYAQNLPTAETKFRNIISKNSAHAPSYFMLYKIMIERKNYSDALFYIRKAQKIDPKNSCYKEELAQTYDIVGNYDKSVPLWLDLSREKPTIENYLFSLADAYLNMQKFKEVIKVYNKLEIIVGYNDEITEAKKNIWLYLNNVKKAVNEYDILIKEFPSQMKYYLKAGDIYLTNGFPNKALPYYQRAQQITPTSPDVQLAFYDYYKTIGDKTKGFDALRNVMNNEKFSIEDKSAILKTVYTSFMLNSLQNLLNKEQMLEIVSIFTVLHSEIADGWSYLATLKLLDDQYEDGRKALENVLALDVSRYTVWEDYFYVLSRLHDYQTIISKDEEIHELFPTNTMLLYTLGVAFLNENKANRAAELFQEAIPFTFDNFLLSKIYYMLGNANFELNRQDEAVKNWKLAKKKGLNSQELNDKLSKYE